MNCRYLHFSILLVLFGFLTLVGTPVIAQTTDNIPTLTWNTFLGGNQDDNGYGIAVDGSGNVYVCGISSATWGSPIRPYTSAWDGFVAKLDSGGNLVWNTFLGGSGDDGPNGNNGIALDDNGNIYVTGLSTGTWESPIRFYTDRDAYVAKLDNNGNLIWNTFLGGSAGDEGFGIAVGNTGNVHVTGVSTASWGSPTRPYTSAWDGFVAKLDSNGNLTWNTFLGGSGDDLSKGIAVDVAGNFYITGGSSATWGEPIRPLTFNGVRSDAFVVKFLMSYNIFGYIQSSTGVGISGVTLTGIPGSPITDINGYYTAIVDGGWSGTATPTKAGYSFSPISRTYTTVSNNQSGQDYSGTLLTLTISGYIQNSQGTGINGVTMKGLPVPTITDGDGYYAGAVDGGWTGTISPNKSGYSFNPFSRSYSNVATNQGNQNYTSLFSTSTRHLPSYYVPSYPVPVTVEVIADPSKIIYVVEDSPPSGWIVKNISHNGLWDNSSKKVKWGPFFDNTSRAFTYKTTPPEGTVGIKTFSGKGSFDGTGIAIGGSLSVELQPEKVFIHLPLIIKD